MKQSKLECTHVDTCLSCYWGGHHLPHVQIPVYSGMKFKEIKEALHSELNIGAVGNNPIARDDSGEAGDRWYKAAHAAINRIKPKVKGQRTFFKDLEKYDPENGSVETVYAFFVFDEI